ncbi:MAG: HAMP domain-containing histidine kinase [Spirochaetaceae bacterium]
MTFRKRYIIILSINTLLSLLFICAIPFGAYNFFSPSEYKNTGLVSQKKFHKELYARLTNNTAQIDKLNRRHIIMIFEQNSGITYSAVKTDVNDLNINTTITNLKMFENSSFSYRTEPFKFKDSYGIFVFRIDKSTIFGYIRLYLIPILLVSTLIFFIIPALINFKLLYSLKMSFFSLEEAAEKVSKGEFDLNLVRDNKDELHSFYESFNKMGLVLKENRDQKARILMSISHDLKTPLTSMKGYIEAFNDKLVPKDKTEKYYKIIKDKSNILEERINTLVDYSKMETTEWKRTFTTINIKEFLTELTMAFKDDCLIYNRVFDYQIDINDKETLSCDSILLNRAIENILENAKRYTAAEGNISLTATIKQGNLKIIIDDNGKGISDSDIKYIFEPFYKVDKGRNSKGMGMGLYTVKSIIESHRGFITCKSSGSGTTFTIELLLLNI